MKAIIIALIALSFVAAALASCDASKATGCSSAVATCIQEASGVTDAICNCYGVLAGCLNDADCGSVLDTFTTTCEAAGCTKEQCSSASGVAISFALVAIAAIAF